MVVVVLLELSFVGRMNQWRGIDAITAEQQQQEQWTIVLIVDGLFWLHFHAVTQRDLCLTGWPAGVRNVLAFVLILGSASPSQIS